MKRAVLVALPALALFGASAFAQAPGAHWSVTATSGAAPSQRRENPGAASDSKMYVFGGRLGNAGTVVVNELWEFDGTSWTMKTGNGAAGSPAARDKAGVTWDFTRNKLIVFGGDDGSGAPLADTWEWDPQTNAWTDITPAPPAVSPSPRRWLAMSHDPATGAILMFGGLDATGAHLNDTWLFAGGTTWIPLTPPGQQPATRRQHHLVERPDYGDVLLFGGQDASLSAPAKWRVDTWRWDGSSWAQIPTAHTPAAVVANDAAYDPIRKRAVLAGGNSVAGVQPTGEISEFDSVTNDWVVRWTVSGDPILGRVSRFFTAYIPSLGKIFKVSGQGGTAASPPTATLEYQSDVIADFTVGSAGCAGPLGTVNLIATQLPWLGRDFAMEVENVPAGASTFVLIGLSPTAIPLSALGIGAASCVITVSPIVSASTVPSGASGNPSLTLNVPIQASLIGGGMLNQAVVLGTSGWVSNRGDAVFGAL